MRLAPTFGPARQILEARRQGIPVAELKRRNRLELEAIQAFLDDGGDPDDATDPRRIPLLEEIHKIRGGLR